MIYGACQQNIIIFITQSLQQSIFLTTNIIIERTAKINARLLALFLQASNKRRNLCHLAKMAPKELLIIT